MASRRLNAGASAVAEPEAHAATPLPEDKKRSMGSSLFGIEPKDLKPFEGKESLPPATWREKTLNGVTTKVFVKPGEPRFFVNKNKVIMVRHGRHRIDRRFYARIYNTVPGKQLADQLKKNRIPGI